MIVVAISAMPASARDRSLSAVELDGYVARATRAWERYELPSGEIVDPLDASDSGDNYGVILLADVMLRLAGRDGDAALTDGGVRIVEEAATLPSLAGPFNRLAVAALLHDGRRGRFPASAWTQIAGTVERLVERVQVAPEAGCLAALGCYSNWRLVQAAGTSLLVASGVPVDAASLKADLGMAVVHAKAPAAPSPLPAARELSDPESEPPAYDVFSEALLELVAEADPGAVTAAVQALRRQVGSYTLELMAPDGQVAYAGRSLDQSWAQAAAVDLGIKRARAEPGRAPAWMALAQRAFSYLLGAYPPRSDGVVPIVPGLLTSWTPALMDSYAALDQYEGLTLWFLADALESWPAASTRSASIPADAGDYLVGDLAASGLVWGRAGRVWWCVSGHTTVNDPRAAQGVVAVKVDTAAGWRDLLALRPIRGGPSTAWTLRLADGQVATPMFTSVHGSGRRAVLVGYYRLADGHTVALAEWVVTPTARGLRVSMRVHAAGELRAAVWLTGDTPARVRDGGHIAVGRCTVSASGPACPQTVTWRRDAELEIG
jgi:hypothetical protein